MSLFRDLFKKLPFGSTLKPWNTSAELQAVLEEWVRIEIP